MNIESTLVYLQVAIDFFAANPTWDYVGLAIGVAIGFFLTLMTWSNLFGILWDGKGSMLFLLFNVVVAITIIAIVMKETHSYTMTAFALVIAYMILRLIRFAFERMLRLS